MKIIEIFITKQQKTVILEDDSDLDLLNYCHNISQIMKSSEVMILQTTSKIAIMRPSKIDIILVNDTSTEEIIPIMIENDNDILIEER